MTKLPIRAHLALLCALTVAAAIVTASVLAWLATRHALRDQVDASLDQSGSRGVVIASAGPLVVGTSPIEGMCVRTGTGFEPPEDLPRVQLLRADGTDCLSGDPGDRVQPTSREYAVAGGAVGQVLRDATTEDGEHVRALTVPLEPGYALTVTRSLEEVDAALRELAIFLSLAAVLGVVVAAGAGLVVARLVLRPVDRLTAAAEHIAETEDLDVPIVSDGRDDEVARLSRAFNAMTSRLAGSRRRQRQLIADASHELRTPLTSLRTNVEWLMRADDRGRPLTPREKRQVEQAVLGQVDELSTLIGELGALARDEGAGDLRRTDLDRVVLRAAERAQRRDPGRRFELRLEPWPVLGDPAALERAVLNLLDNALKFSDGPVAVTLDNGRLEVADRGPGLPADQQSHAFDRFWRAPTARELPGSGLGLAIVADGVERHGGQVFFGSAPHGGAVVGFWLPRADGESLTELSASPSQSHIQRP